MQATDWPHYEAASKAAVILNDANFEAYIIGGAVRDMLLGLTPKDFDLVTNATPEQVLKLEGFTKSLYKDTAQAFGVTRVVVGIEFNGQSHEIELEVATYRQDIEAHLGRKQTKVAFASLADDLQRRDFTINALALNPDTQQLIDEVGGLEDLKHKLVRFIGEPDMRIQEDPLRLLRAIRFKSQLSFSYEPATKAAVARAIYEHKLSDIASERIGFELSRMLTHANRSSALQDLDGLGALEHLLPEVTAGKSVEQPPDEHAEGDVFRHTMLAMSYLPDIISPRLAWATLLHDIAKPVTARTAQDRIRFDEHYKVGAEMSGKILKRLHFGKHFRDDVAWLVHHHLSIDTLPKMRPGRAAQLMHHPAFADLLELHKADAQAAWNRQLDGSIDKSQPDFSVLEAMWTDFQKQDAQHPPSLKHDLGIDGSWLMKKFNLPGNQRIGELLEKLENAYLDGKITTAVQAEAMARRLVNKDNSQE